MNQCDVGFNFDTIQIGERHQAPIRLYTRRARWKMELCESTLCGGSIGLCVCVCGFPSLKTTVCISLISQVLPVHALHP